MQFDSLIEYSVYLLRDSPSEFGLDLLLLRLDLFLELLDLFLYLLTVFTALALFLERLYLSLEWLSELCHNLLCLRGVK